MSIVLAMEAGEGSGHSRRSRHFTPVFFVSKDVVVSFPAALGQKR